MKYVRFYLEFPSSYAKRKGKHLGNCIARFVDGGRSEPEGLGSVFSWPNSPVGTTAFHPRFLSVYCKRISEKRAREIHPRLFEFLDE